MDSIFSGIPKEKRMDIEWINNVWLPNIMKQRGLTWKKINKRLDIVMANRLPESDEQFEARIIAEAKKDG